MDCGVLSSLDCFAFVDRVSNVKGDCLHTQMRQLKRTMPFCVASAFALVLFACTVRADSALEALGDAALPRYTAPVLALAGRALRAQFALESALYNASDDSALLNHRPVYRSLASSAGAVRPTVRPMRAPHRVSRGVCAAAALCLPLAVVGHRWPLDGLGAPRRHRRHCVCRLVGRLAGAGASAARSPAASQCQRVSLVDGRFGSRRRTPSGNRWSAPSGRLVRGRPPRAPPFNAHRRRSRWSDESFSVHRIGREAAVFVRAQRVPRLGGFYVEGGAGGALVRVPPADELEGDGGFAANLHTLHLYQRSDLRRWLIGRDAGDVKCVAYIDCDAAQLADCGGQWHVVDRDQWSVDSQMQAIAAAPNVPLFRAIRLAVRCVACCRRGTLWRAYTRKCGALAHANVARLHTQM